MALRAIRSYFHGLHIRPEPTSIKHENNDE